MFPPSQENRDVIAAFQPDAGPTGSRFHRAIDVARRRWRQFALWGAIATVAVIGTSKLGEFEDLPDFGAIDDPAERKALFISRVAPMAGKVNREIELTRERLLIIDAGLATGRPVGPVQRNFVRAVARRYGFDDDREINREWLREMLARVDVVPVSLVVAQAAIESGWGTSRFARHGNNLFGMRVYDAGEGMVPRERAPGEEFEVAVYDDPGEAIRSYVHNLNTHARYRDLRELRAQQRRAGAVIDGERLADGLLHYSEQGAEYVGQVKSVISYNELGKFDR